MMTKLKLFKSLLIPLLFLGMIPLSAQIDLGGSHLVDEDKYEEKDEGAFDQAQMYYKKIKQLPWKERGEKVVKRPALFARLLSQKWSRKALTLAYQALEVKDRPRWEQSELYRIIIDLECRKGAFTQAERMAIRRLDHLYRDWADAQKSPKIGRGCFEDFVKIYYGRASSGNRRRTKVLAVCGTEPNWVSRRADLREAQILFNHFDPIFALRYFQDFPLALNEIGESEIQVNQEINTLCTEVLLKHFPKEYLLEQFEAAPLRKIDANHRFGLSMDFFDAKYIIDFMGMELILHPKIIDPEVLGEEMSLAQLATLKKQSIIWTTLLAAE